MTLKKEMGSGWMRKVYLIAQTHFTSDAIKEQLREMFGADIDVVAKTVDECEKIDFTDGLVVLTSPWVEDYAKAKIMPGLDYIVAKRVINYDYLEKLSNLNDGEDILVCSPWQDVKEPAIEQLRDIGFTNINFIPCDNSFQNENRVRTAIIFSEAVVPKYVENIIEMSPRMLDVSSLVEIQKKLNLSNENAILSQFSKRIMTVLKRVNEESNKNKEIKILYQTIVNNISEGIVYSNEHGSILIVNKAVEKFFGHKIETLIGSKIEEYFLNQNCLQKNDFDKNIVSSITGDLALSRISLFKDDQINGYVFILEDVERILSAERKIRLKNLSHEIAAKYTFDDIIYRSEKIHQVIINARKFAASNETILIQGGSGTGKEIFAQAIHNCSPRKNGPFVPVNFAALTETLLESELFGYEEGSFTGAKKGGKRGLFERSHGGTIFIDEIGDAPVAFQARLLRVLQEKQIKRVGSTEIIPIDIRVIAATNLNLWDEVQKGRFRQDLFFRLSVLPIYIPGLKERKEDIPVLLSHFLKDTLGVQTIELSDIFTQEAIALLLTYEWPGNVRELINATKYVCAIKYPGKLVRPQEMNLYRQAGSGNVDADTMMPEIKWLLSEINHQKGAGRRFLADEAIKQGINLSESQIRNHLKKMESEGYLTITIGASGCVLTEKGRLAVE